MKRGDLVTIADRSGDFTGKPRPAVVVQSDLFDDLGSVTVCPITSAGRNGLARIPIVPSELVPIRRPSWIEVDKIITMQRRRTGVVIGRLGDADMQRVNGALLVFLGIG